MGVIRRFGEYGAQFSPNLLLNVALEFVEPISTGRRFLMVTPKRRSRADADGPNPMKESTTIIPKCENYGGAPIYITN